MKRTLITVAALAAMLAGPAMAQQTVVTTTTTTERVTRPLSLAPQQRTRIKEYVVQQRAPVVRERVIVGEPLPQEVELQAVPQEWARTSHSIATSIPTTMWPSLTLRHAASLK